MTAILEDYKQQLLNVPSIVEVNIPTPPTSYEAYLYLFTNLENSKKYLGIHKGLVEDNYYNSSKNKEFAEDYTNSKSRFKFEVLSYGDYSKMSSEEERILQTNNAKENPNWYNLSNGGSKKEKLRMDVVQKIVDRIVSGEFDCVDENGEWIKEDKTKIYNLEKLQVREVQYIPSLVSEIVDRIEDAMGNTDACDPILIYEERLSPKKIKGDREDLIGDGNNTIHAVYKSKSAVSIQTRRIPYDVHKDLSNLELRAIGGLLNKRPDKVKEPASIDDAVKFIVGSYENSGLGAESSQNLEYLRAVGYTSQQIKKTILPKAKNAIAKKQFALSNQIFIEYGSDSPHRQTLIDLTESYNDSTTYAQHTSSGNIRMDRIMTKFREVHQINPNKKKLVVVVHHPEPSDKERWDNGEEALHNKEIKFWIKGLGFDFEWVQMPHLMDNKLVD
jgi:hypothetical protein